MAENGNRAGIGAALSSGGASSLAQIGVLERLLEGGISIDCVAGTSGGSIVGSVLAAGRLADFRAAACEITWRRVFRLFNLVWPRGAVLEFRPALDFVRPFVPETIDAMPSRFAAVAVDLMSGEKVVLREGGVLEAVRASCSIPGIFRPVAREGRWLADGALANPLPVDVARRIGAGFVVAVNTLPADEEHADRFADDCRARAQPTLLERIRSRFLRKAAEVELAEMVDEATLPPAVSSDRALRLIQVLVQTSRIVQCKIAAARLREEPADFLINVPVGDVGIFDFHRAAELVERGRDAAEKALPELEQALAARAPSSARLRTWWRDRRGSRLVAAPRPILAGPQAVGAE